MSDKKRIILVTGVCWAGCDIKVDVTDWYNSSECKTIDEFMEQNGKELSIEAIQTQGLEWHVREGTENELN